MNNEKANAIDLGIELLDENEYFIPLKSYKTGRVVNNYAISNYGRVFSREKSKKWIPIVIRKNTTQYSYKVSVGFGRDRDILSLTKLIVYNFDPSRFIINTYYYIQDTSKYPTADNIWPISPQKKNLTKEQEEELLKCIRNGKSYTWIVENHYDFPANAVKRFLADYFDEGSMARREVRDKAKKIEIDKDLTKAFMDALDSITKKDMESNYLTAIFKNIAQKLNLRYSHSLYTRAYNYFTGRTPEARVFLRDKFND